MTKRERQDLLLLILMEEAGECSTCYYADVNAFQEEEIQLMINSLPSERYQGVPGCLDPEGDDDSLFDDSIWTSVDYKDVSSLENIGRVVIAFGYE